MCDMAKLALLSHIFATALFCGSVEPLLNAPRMESYGTTNSPYCQVGIFFLVVFAFGFDLFCKNDSLFLYLLFPFLFSTLEYRATVRSTGP